MVSVIDMSKKKFASEIADATKIDGPQLGCVSRHSVPLLQMELLFLKWLHKSVHGSSGVLKRRKLTRTYETVLFLFFFFTCGALNSPGCHPPNVTGRHDPRLKTLKKNKVLKNIL